MKFPIINISVEKWNDNEDMSEYISYDKFIYTNEDSVFDKYYKNMLFCDSNGVLFLAIRKSEIKEKWRIWLKFIPNVWKFEVIFKQTPNETNTEELREYFLARISELKKTNSREEWIQSVKNAKSHFEIIHGTEKKY